MLILNPEIRKAVLEGKIDQALKCTNAYYPQVLKDNDQVYFRLRCRKFIEMIRRDAEENLRLEANPDLERKGFSARTGHYHGTEDAEMVDDDDDDDGDWGEHMDTEDGDRDGEVMDVGKLLEEALAYGQELRAEFDGQQQREMAKQLDQIFALIAYPNPLKVKEVSHLLDRAGRVTVAEELNSAILRKFIRLLCFNLVYTTPSPTPTPMSLPGRPGYIVNSKLTYPRLRLPRQVFPRRPRDALRTDRRPARRPPTRRQ